VVVVVVVVVVVAVVVVLLLRPLSSIYVSELSEVGMAKPALILGIAGVPRFANTSPGAGYYDRAQTGIYFKPAREKGT
jgi:hypothetical protein